MPEPAINTLPMCQRCGQTGTISEIGVFFPPGRTLRLCGHCLQRRQRREIAGWVVAILLFVGAVGWWAAWVASQSAEFSFFLTWFAGIFFWLIVMMWAHELGHAAAAKLVGIRVLGLSLGRGPRLWRWKLGNYFVDWHVIPTSGVCWSEVNIRPGYRWRRAVMTAAGPAVHVLTIAAIVWSGVGGLWWLIALLVNGEMFLVAMWPSEGVWNGTVMRNDGGQILDLLSGKMSLSAMAASMGGWVRELVGLAEQGRWADVQHIGRLRLQMAHWHPVAMVEIGAWVAVADVWAGGPNDLREADEISKKGIEMMHTNLFVEAGAGGAALKTVRACVLLGLGRDAEAERWLKEAWEGKIEGAAKKAAPWLWAELFRRRGDAVQEAQWMKTGEELDPGRAYAIKWPRLVIGPAADFVATLAGG